MIGAHTVPLLRGARALFAVALIWGCGDGDPTPDGGVDASLDAAIDAGVEDAAQDVADGGTPGIGAWSPCGEGRAECAELTVPVDYDDPGQGTMVLPLLRLPALATDRIGVLFVAHGAADSGVELAADMPRIMTPAMGEVLRRFDIVGMDLRGNGSSRPQTFCYDSGDEAAEALNAIDAAIPDDEAVARAVEGILADCRAYIGIDLRYFSTAHRVRDIDYLRAELGEEQLSLLGFSYGTWTSTAYALRYPDRVRAAALYSALAVVDTYDRVRESMRGIDAALTGFFEWCDAQEACAFRPDRGTTRERFDALVPTLEGQLREQVRTYVSGILWMNRGQTVDEDYSDLGDVLRAAEIAPSLLPPIETRAGIRTTIEQMLDLVPPAGASYADWRTQADELRGELVSWGPFVASWDDRVVFGVAWDQPRDVIPVAAIPEAPPFYFVAAHRDPITPAEYASALAAALGNDSIVLDTQIVGHHTLRRTPCPAENVTAYLLDPSTPDATPCTVPSSDETVIGSVSDVFAWGAEADSRVTETAIGDLVADAMRADARTQLALINGGGIRTALPAGSVAPADTSLRRPQEGYAAGPPYDLVVDDVRATLPFGNRIVTIEITGERLWAFLEETLAGYDGEGGNALVQISGFAMSFDAGAEPGARVLSVELEGGEPIPRGDSTRYTLALVDFVYYGGTGIESLIDSPASPGRAIDDALVDYIMDNSGTAGMDLIPTTHGRIDIR